MRWRMSSLGMAVAAPLGAMALAWSGAGPIPLPTVPAPTELLAQSLYMRGTKIGGYTDDDAFFVKFANGVIAQTDGSANALTEDTGDDWMTGDQVEYNGGFWPVSHGGLNDLTYGASVEQGLGRLGERIAAEGTDDTVVVYGYSQSAVILSRYKAQTAQGNIVYVLVSNPTRPNGGILSRFRGFTIPIIDVPLSGPAPTTSPGWQEGDPPTTYDITQQYDGWADFPLYPLNVLATANAVMGIVYLHGSYETEVDPEHDLGLDAPNTDTDAFGDTHYYTVGTGLLPLLRPLEQIGVPRPVLLGFDAPLRVLVEQGYDRTINPGASTPARLIRNANPLNDIANFVNAIPVGIDDGLEAAGYGRPLNTTPAGMYGVGGPQVKPPSTDSALKPVPESVQRPTSAEDRPVTDHADDVDHAGDVADEKAGDAPVVKKPDRRQAERPSTRRPVNLTRAITTAIRGDKTTADKTTSEMTAADKPESDPPAKKLAKRTERPDRGGGYVGKHRKREHRAGTHRGDAPSKKDSADAGV